MIEQLTDLIADSFGKLDKFVVERFEPEYERGREIAYNSRVCGIIGSLLMLIAATVVSVAEVVFGIFLCLVGAAAFVIEDIDDHCFK